MVNRMTTDLRIEGSRNRNSAFYGQTPDIPMSRLVFGGNIGQDSGKSSTHLMSVSAGTSSGIESQEGSVVTGHELYRLPVCMRFVCSTNGVVICKLLIYVLWSTSQLLKVPGMEDYTSRV